MVPRPFRLLLIGDDHRHRFPDRRPTRRFDFIPVSADGDLGSHLSVPQLVLTLIQNNWIEVTCGFSIAG